MSDDSAVELPPSSTRPPTWWFWLDGLAVAAILPSVLSGTARWWWVGDLCVHFRVPYAIALLVLAIVYLTLRRRRWLLTICVVLGVNISLLWPLYAGGLQTTGSSMSLRVMTANVYIGNRNPEPVLEAIRSQQPDVVLLMEVDDRWLRDLDTLKADYPYTAFAVRDEESDDFGPFGLALFSRQPLGEIEIHRLGTARVPAIVTQVTAEGQSWSLVGVHPYPPVSSDCARARDTLLAELAPIAAACNGPTVLFGDLNITRWSPHFADLLTVSGLSDSSLGQGYQPTWPDVLPVPLIPIDHILVSQDVAVLHREVGPSIESDHRPVLADLGLRAALVSVTTGGASE